jgi:hypothetical protein
MSEQHLVNVWLYQFAHLEWHCRTFDGIVGIGRTRDEAKQTFDRDWADRAPYRLIEGPPPRPKRADERPIPDRAIESDSIAFTALAKAFHPDACGRRNFTADEVMTIVNQLREQTRANHGDVK